VILGIARTLATNRVAPGEQDELLQRLISRTTSLGRLVERFEAVTDTGSEEQIDIGRLAVEMAAAEPRVQVTVPDELPKVIANRVLARRILEELIDNACRFSPPETAVELSIDRSPGRLSLRVTDKGEGIRPQDQERVFEPLEQVEHLDARTHEGAGLGLSLARAAARAMEGDITLERSGPGGSTFLWTLPLDRR
jgi:two-component system sensor histidine kinase KdpD